MRYWSKAWSLIEGCTPVSEGCEHCWLAQMEHRFGAMKIKGEGENVNYCPSSLTDNVGRFKGKIRFHPDRLNIPLKTKKPTVFAIWSDLFHEDVSEEFIRDAFAVMGFEAQRHTYLVLTKRPERMAKIVYYFLRHENIWLGTTVENQEQADKRIPELLRCRPFPLWLSIEPMLGPIEVPPDTLEKVSQVILGGETGRGARPMHPDWVRSIRDQCEVAKVPFFFKGWGSPKTAFYMGLLLDGQEHNELAWKI